MSFEEEFPSLRGGDAYPLRYRRAIPPKNILSAKDIVDEELTTIRIETKEMRVFPEDEIQEHCLDKQRVREILSRYEDRIKTAEGLTTEKKMNKIALQIMKEELGL